jgi:ribosomal-protein-alanine N-acetyltransferase
MDKPSIFLIKQLEESEIMEVLQIQESNNLGKWSFADYLSVIENKKTAKLVVKFKDKTIGFVIMRLIKLWANKHLLLNESGSGNPFSEGEIYNMGIHNSYKKNGIGTLLLNYLIQNCETYSLMSVWLEVRESNYPAINFYKKNNFEKIYTRKNYYDNPKENAIVMKLDLSGSLKPTKVEHTG